MIKRFIFLTVVGLIGFALFGYGNLKSRPAEIPILIYHGIQPDGGKGGWNNADPTESELEKQLKHLKDNGYTTISFGDLINYFDSDAALPESPVIITFDDSLSGQYKYALPTLQKYGLSATFFIWSDAVGREGFMSWNEIRGIHATEMEIGGHTLSHPHLTRLNSEKIRNEILENKKIIEREIGEKIHAFAYPYGEYNNETIKIAKSVGYDSARSAGNQIKSAKNKLFNLGGFIVGRDLYAFKKYLNSFRDNQ